MRDLLCPCLAVSLSLRGASYGGEQFQKMTGVYCPLNTLISSRSTWVSLSWAPYKLVEFCFSGTASQPPFTSRAGEQLVLTDQEGSMFWL